MRIILILLFQAMFTVVWAQPTAADEEVRWKKQAKDVSIIRDGYGIAHVYGKTDANTVFGLLFAQCEDDFYRVEANYIDVLGRRAELEGVARLYDDLGRRLIIDPEDARKDFENAPQWLRELCEAFADRVNFYLHTHPEVKPKLLDRFEPWWPLLWTDGSIAAINMGGATNRELAALYDEEQVLTGISYRVDEMQDASNGFAFAPVLTQNNKPILFINPHVSLYFRTEAHVVSENGLNAYGAITWGQFFVFQGFNEYCGWMHTATDADVSDLYYLELDKNKKRYRFDGKWLPLQTKTVKLKIREAGGITGRSFTTYFTHHGPVVGMRDGKWMALQHNNRSMNNLIQGLKRNKAGSFEEFREILAMRQNPSTNTLYADRQGNIAYWHGNFLPIRNDSFDWSKPVPGNTSASGWKGYHTLDELVHYVNPANGWIQNCNSTPYSALGDTGNYPLKFPKYAAPEAENFRAINAIDLWKNARNLTLDSVIIKSYTRRLPAFEVLVPALQKAWQTHPEIPDSLRDAMTKAVDRLSGWNFHTADTSIAATLALEWGDQLLPALNRRKPATAKFNTGQMDRVLDFAANAHPQELLEPLQQVLTKLVNRFGYWEIPWGQLNRYQRLTGQLKETYSDSMPSLPVPFASQAWGALATYQSRVMPGTNRRYGTYGNSFVAAVEFGDKLRAKSLLAGGNSSHPRNLFYEKEAIAFTRGEFKEVWFYKEDVERNAIRTYRPGWPGQL